jgi:hypothetical protein
VVDSHPHSGVEDRGGVPGTVEALHRVSSAGLVINDCVVLTPPVRFDLGCSPQACSLILLNIVCICPILVNRPCV